MPTLYMVGITKWVGAVIQNAVPSRQAVGEKTSLAIAFAAGAMISGVLGNLTYDLLKLAVKKLLARR